MKTAKRDGKRVKAVQGPKAVVSRLLEGIGAVRKLEALTAELTDDRDFEDPANRACVNLMRAGRSLGVLVAEIVGVEAERASIKVA